LYDDDEPLTRDNVETDGAEVDDDDDDDDDDDVVEADCLAAAADEPLEQYLRGSKNRPKTLKISMRAGTVLTEPSRTKWSISAERHKKWSAGTLFG
jgi:hypothetical protein